MKKILHFLIIGFLGSLFLLVGHIFAENETEATHFHGTIEKARFGLLERGLEASPAFEELLKIHSGEWMVYAAYADTLHQIHEFDKALEVYDRVLALKSETLIARREEAQERKEALERYREFQASMEGAVPWDQASVFGNGQIAIKSNIPREHIDSIFEHTQEIYRREKEILGRLLPNPEEQTKPIEILIFGNFLDYRNYLKKQYGPVWAHKLQNNTAYFENRENRIIVLFNGGGDWLVLSRVMANYLLKNFYATDLSAILNEGLSFYLSAHLEKESGKRFVLSWLEYIFWLHNQGRWGGLEEFFDQWKKYHPSTNRFRYDLRSASDVVFQAAMLIQFFMSTEIPKFQEFFRKYLQYEKTEEAKGVTDVRDYFYEHLSEEDILDLDKQWLEFTLSRTFETL